MILWENTKNKYGYNEENCPSIRKRPIVVVQCDDCNHIETKKLTSKNKNSNHHCKSCISKKRWASSDYKNKTIIGIKGAWKNEEYRSKQILHLKFGSEANKKRWKDPKYREKMSRSLSKSSKGIWQREEYKTKMINILRKNRENSPLMREFRTDEEKENLRQLAINRWSNDVYGDMPDKLREIWSDQNKLDISSKKSEKLWKDEKFRNKVIKAINKEECIEKIRKASLERWKKPEYREKMAKIRSSQPKVSSLQKILYSILDDLGTKYFREHNNQRDDLETLIGPYHFDCVVPTTKNKKLLIECQGDYWHSLDKAIARDKAKATYIERYHKNCEIKYLWEHEFSCLDKITETIKYWLGISELETISFSFKNIEIKECRAKDYKLLLSKYHYLPNAGRGGIAFGAYLNNELIAVCIFSPLIRQNLPWDKKSTRELSRLCIHPRYQKKNFASWFVSRCIKVLNPQYKTIISYCDTTFNHNGATYKACNFKLDGEVKPDYWYVSKDGWVMHKKTLYNHAIKMSMKEKDYALLNKYEKVYGKKKLRFVFKRTHLQSQFGD